MKEQQRKIIAFFILFSALAMCAYGASAGEAAAVLKKAVSICMECIGLG